MLIHKTMKMPTSCLSCWISPTCEVWVGEKSRYKGYDDRLDECPLEEVVRCKDCRWGKEACGNIECFADLNAPTEYHGYEWYCPNGERGFEDEVD